MTLAYAVITPARDEAENLPRLAACLANQSVLPSAWVVVDNGSTDETSTVAAELARQHPWIRVVSASGESGQIRGGPVVRAFHVGLSVLDDGPHALVAKVDADVSFDSDYFERLVTCFERDPQLGIASGTCFEVDGRRWRARHVTRPNVWGAARVYRRACLEALLPLDDRMGWDAIDVIRARVAGWETRTMTETAFRHHRVEAERDGAQRLRWLSQGRVARYLRYRPSYLVLRAIHHSRRDPAALALVWGFVQASLAREAQCADASLVAHLRDQQRLRRVPARVIEAFGRPQP